MPLPTPTIDSPVPGALLRHYKGGLYEVIGTCVIEATVETGILYKPLQGDMQDVIWMRPLSEFQDKVETAQGWVPRFQALNAAPKR